MQPVVEAPGALPAKASEFVLRTLRHEVGDLLQTVYSAVAILNQRLPPNWDLERRVVNDLKSRGEDCRKYLDCAHDLLSPLTLDKERSPVAEVLERVLERIRMQHPKLEVQMEIAPNLVGWFDAKRLHSMFQLVIKHASEMAAKGVWIKAHSGKAAHSLVTSVEFDTAAEGSKSIMMSEQSGFGIAGVTQDIRSRLGLLLAEKLVRLHGGDIHVTRVNDSVMSFRIALPGDSESVTSVNG